MRASHKMIKHAFKFASSVVFLLSAAVANATPMQWAFSGFIWQSYTNIPGCLGLCGQDLPPGGNPISFSMVIDQAPTAYVSKNTFNITGGLSKVDFGYSPIFAFSNFYMTVVNNNNGSAQDLQIFSDQPPSGVGNVASFSIDIGSFSSNLLSGNSIPTSLNLSLADWANGRLNYVPQNNINITESAEFTINSLSISPVPEPESYAMMLVGLGLLASARRRE